MDELIKIGVAQYGEPFDRALKATTIAVNGRSIHLLEGGKTRLGKDDKVWMLAPAAGG